MTTSTAIACPQCHLRFRNRPELLAHLDDEHPAPIDTVPPPRGWVTVPVDPDEPPPLALTLAVTLANQADLALDVVAAPHLGGPLGAAAYLRTNVTRIREVRPERRAWHVLDGKPGPAVLDHIASASPDLVCMGTRGHRGVGELLLGSLAHDVMARATVPVLFVGPKVRSLPDRIRTVVACVEGSDEARAALTVADRLRRVLSADLLLLEVVHPMYPGPSDTVESAEVARFAHGLDGPPANFDVLHRADAAAAIVDHTEGMGGAILVTGTHGRTGVKAALLGSVAREVVATSSLPTLVVPPGADGSTFLVG